MTKRFNKIGCFILAMVMMLSSYSLTAFANETDYSADEGITPYYSVMNTNATGFKISGTQATCTASMTAPTGTSLKIKMELQRKSGSSYTTQYTWSTSKVSSALAISKTQTINPIATWRLKCTFTANSEVVVTYKP
ncbi:MAG: hypothetical protein ACI4IG_03395 [Eubacterium sp.]